MPHPRRFRRLSRPKIPALAAVLGFACALGGASLRSQESRPPEDINRSFENPDVEEFVRRFERPGREVYDKRFEILEACNFRRGEHVADVGAGTGLFTLLIAERIGPEGRVYAVDISDAFLRFIADRARKAGLKNVETIRGTQFSTRLPPRSVDKVFVCDTYHHFEDPGAMLRSIHRALKPGGELIVIDFERIEGKSSDWVLRHVRAGKDTVRREIESEGFRLVEDRPFLETSYFLRFRKISGRLHVRAPGARPAGRASLSAGPPSSVRRNATAPPSAPPRTRPRAPTARACG